MTNLKRILKKRTLMAAIVGCMTISACGCSNTGRLSEAELREFYCESVRCEDENNCVRVPVNPEPTADYGEYCRSYYWDDEPAAQSCLDALNGKSN